MGISEHPRFAQIEKIRQTIIGIISSKQEDYFTTNGKYFQGIMVPDVFLDGMSDVTADFLVKPSDQSDSWKDFDSETFKSSFKLPANISLHVYEAPSGWGWRLFIELVHTGLGPDNYGNDGDHWMYCYNNGPEIPPGVWNDWFIFVEEEL